MPKLPCVAVFELGKTCRVVSSLANILAQSDAVKSVVFSAVKGSVKFEEASFSVVFLFAVLFVLVSVKPFEVSLVLAVAWIRFVVVAKDEVLVWSMELVVDSIVTADNERVTVDEDGLTVDVVAELNEAKIVNLCVRLLIQL